MTTIAEPWDYSPRLTVLSFGGGQDSHAILYMLALNETFRRMYAPHDLLIIMSDTGNEHPATYMHVNSTRKFCDTRGLEFVFLTSDMGFHRGNWTSLTDYFRAYNLVMTKVFNKSCTDQLKIQPIYRYLNAWIAARYGYEPAGGKYREKSAIVQFAQEHGQIRVLLGIARGEESRVASEKEIYSQWMRIAVRREYPLLWLGWDRADCQRFIAERGFVVPPPSNCMFCPFMDRIELLWMALSFPEEFEEWVEFEAQKLKKFARRKGKNVAVFGGKKTLREVLAEAKQKYGHLSLAELEAWRFSHGHCVKSHY